jgi:hypothetical protein
VGVEFPTVPGDGGDFDVFVAADLGGEAGDLVLVLARQTNKELADAAGIAAETLNDLRILDPAARTSSTPGPASSTRRSGPQ